MSIIQELNVRVLGTGEDVVVLGHGLGTDQSVWQHIIPHLVDNYRVVLFDLMGAGNTDPDSFSFHKYSSLSGYVDDLLGVLRALNISTCKYVGHSVSGMIGMLASTMHPELFERIVTISASPRYLNDGLTYHGGFEQSDLNSVFDAMSSNYKSWVLGFAPLCLDDDIESPAVQEFCRTFFTMRPDIALAMTKMIFQSDMRGILPHVTVPCHILQSNGDLAVPISVAHYIAGHLINTKSCVEIFDNVTGHIPQLVRPEVVIPVLIRHLTVRLDDLQQRV